MSVPVGPLVVLLRHGETAWNVAGRFQGQHDTDLTDRGQEQAAAAGEALRAAVGDREVRLVTSDLRRARATAEAVAGSLAVPVRADPRLREIAAGSWQGLLQPEIEALDPEAFAAWRAGDDIRLGGAETPGEAGARVRDAVEQHAAHLADQEWLLVVGHGASIRSGLAQLLGQPELRRVLVPLGNTGTAVLAPGRAVGGSPGGPGRGGWRLHGWNLPPSALGQVLGRRGSASASVT